MSFKNQIGANSDDGFIAGAVLQRRTYGFRNDPYATDQKFDAFIIHSKPGVTV
jgi:hypothetical protein